MLSKTKQASVFLRLLSYLKAYRLLTVLALSFLLLTTVVRSLIPLLASYFIDHYISTISETAVAILAAYFALYLLQWYFNILEISGLLKFPTALSEIFAGMPLGEWKSWEWLTSTRLLVVPLSLASPMIRRVFQRCFQGFYPVLSQLSLLSSRLFRPCLLWIGN